ncbi:adenylyl-sulfate kinase [Paludibaculum fermentans]|uniref:Adenylyl-sulfate kinase n=1 Tax=Paludibaculum fermentans TaxID=1473598 RepID=A0A7S7NJV7_PALFE|nr:adenylyl-sulfate kinase [Paludibaculum fermentans]QOY84986.1 adenylyl-sulfate kinase [Paludibaculum fermentans]
MESTLLRFTAIGSVDDGKSTLIGRLLHDQSAVYDDQLDSIRRVSREGLDLALITDGLRAEREQGITIDVAYRYFSTPRRRFIIADTPGHEQYTRNMVTGSSTADVAVVLIDARLGVLPQTLRHTYLSWLLGIRRICVAVNKMDAVGFNQSIFESIRAALLQKTSGLPALELAFLPVSALQGDNVVHRGASMPWFDGPTLLEYLETVQPPPAHHSGLRLPVQAVLRGANSDRFYAGQLSGGSVQPGDQVLLLPSGKFQRVASVRLRDEALSSAATPMSISVSLDGHVDLSRGDMIVDPLHPPASTRHLKAILFWMSSDPLSSSKAYLLKHTTQTVCAEITSVDAALDVATLRFEPSSALGLNDIARVTLETQRPIYCDPYTANRATGSFILVDPVSNGTIAAGIIESAEQPAGPSTLSRPGDHAGGVLWLTGLSSSGKSTLAVVIHQRLKDLGYRVEMLDGDIVRKHLSKGLGFSKEDRDENIRRIGFVAELLARNGVVAIVSAISPYRAIRGEVRARIANFIEIYVNAPLAICEQRDVKGLYRRARTGELKGMTGIDDPYEPPVEPEVECRTDLNAVEACVGQVLRYAVDRLDGRSA